MIFFYLVFFISHNSSTYQLPCTIMPIIIIVLQSIQFYLQADVHSIVILLLLDVVMYKMYRWAGGKGKGQSKAMYKLCNVQVSQFNFTRTIRFNCPNCYLISMLLLLRIKQYDEPTANNMFDYNLNWNSNFTTKRWSQQQDDIITITSCYDHNIMLLQHHDSHWNLEKKFWEI